MAALPRPRALPREAMQLGRLIAGDPRIRLAFVALGGWDTHVDQGGASRTARQPVAPARRRARRAGRRARRRLARHGGRRCCRNLAAPSTKTATAAPITAMATSIWLAGGAVTRRPGLRRLAGAGAGASSISAGTSRSRPIFARRCRRSSACICVSPNTSSMRCFRARRRPRPGWPDAGDVTCRRGERG